MVNLTLFYPRMSDKDLEALYIYLNKLDPIEHDVGEILFKKEMQLPNLIGYYIKTFDPIGVVRQIDVFSIDM